MKCICVYVDGGKGHYVPAKAVMEELINLGVETRIEELFDYLDIKWLGRINKLFWRTMLQMPRIERKLSKHNDSDSNGMELAIRFGVKHCWRMLEANLEEFRPDFIFATHPYASTVLSEMLASRNIDIPVYYFATDVFNAPVASICPKIRKFLISTADGAKRVERMGQSPESIAIVPFPLQQVLAKNRMLAKEEAREKLGLRKDLFTLQLNLGGEGIGSMSLLWKLLSLDLPCQIVILGGLDKADKARIQEHTKLKRSKNAIVHIPGFVTNVDEYLAASDIVAGRAGINTIVEAIYAHRPFLITELVYTVVPSAEFVVKHNVGWNAADDKERQVEIVADLIQHPEKLDEMDSSFSTVPIEFGADKLASFLLEDIRK